SAQKLLPTADLRLRLGNSRFMATLVQPQGTWVALWVKPQSLGLADQKVGGSNPRDGVSTRYSVPAPANLAVRKHIKITSHLHQSGRLRRSYRSQECRTKPGLCAHLTLEAGDQRCPETLPGHVASVTSLLWRARAAHGNAVYLPARKRSLFIYLHPGVLLNC
uniref:Uncharacterized protein n=1 Tax=Podarcis muralis TaxID=64176 RepID=A0A670J8T0_PODMU